MIENEKAEVWFLTGSQHLYGEETLRQVARNSQEIAESIGRSGKLPVRVVWKPVLTGPDAIREVCQAASSSPDCIGVITWMHTFSPAKMWIGGLRALGKPFLHLHTQYNRDLPWREIDMDFMNLNQSAHGDREFGFIGARLRMDRKVVVGYWEDPVVRAEVATWMRAARAWSDWQGARFARFGDNMRQVAVTEGNKVSAEIAFGYTVDGYGLGDLVARVASVQDAELGQLVQEYLDRYEVMPELRPGGERHVSLREGARIELGLRAFLDAGGFKGLTTTFEDLHGLGQLPGLGIQRLMADGYGFGAEGDWKTAALVRAMKVMADGLPGGTSFMEDYTYHLAPGREQVLGAHMLEVCESLASGKPRLEIHRLGIGGKADPVRLVFDGAAGPALNASLVDLGNRFRLLVNRVEAVAPPEPLPRLPVARVVWQPKPDLRTAAGAWILAGGAHHTGYSRALTIEHLEDFARMAGIECLVIDEHTRLREFERDARLNDLYYSLARGLGNA
jgi:L-arabinose isomerase